MKEKLAVPLRLILVLIVLMVLFGACAPLTNSPSPTPTATPLTLPAVTETPQITKELKVRYEFFLNENSLSELGASLPYFLSDRVFEQIDRWDFSSFKNKTFTVKWDPRGETGPEIFNSPIWYYGDMKVLSYALVPYKLDVEGCPVVKKRVSTRKYRYYLGKECEFPPNHTVTINIIPAFDYCKEKVYYWMNGGDSFLLCNKPEFSVAVGTYEIYFSVSGEAFLPEYYLELREVVDYFGQGASMPEGPLVPGVIYEVKREWYSKP